jgi:two-component system, cell cycle sensor histidine kinase and response regulator CckA
MGRTYRGNYLALEISETGSGITLEAQAKLFGSFFTTKGAGRGLGLALIQGIVMSPCRRDQSGECTRPRYDFSSAAAVHRTADKSFGRDPVALAERIQPRSATILVLEDEELLRLSVSKALRKRTFSVVEASDGSAAMGLIRANTEGITFDRT